MEVILLIYQDYEGDEVTKKSDTLRANRDGVTVYHFPEDAVVEFFAERKKGSIKEVFYTSTVAKEYKTLFSKPPYNGTQMD